MSAFSETIFEFFHSETVEKVETTLGNVWELKQGWNSFVLCSPIRKFLELQFLVQSSVRQRMVIHLRDFNNDNFFAKAHWVDPAIVGRFRTACPTEWLEVIDIFCPLGAAVLIDVQAIGATKSYVPYMFNASQDFEVQSQEAIKKATPSGLEFANEFQDPYQVVIRSKNAFAEGTIYVEHFSADSATKIISGGQEEIDIKGKVSICKGGGHASRTETVIRSSGGKLKYQTEALIQGSPTIKIVRTQEGPTYGKSYI